MKYILIILISVLFSSSSQILLKIGAKNLVFEGSTAEIIKSVLLNFYIIGGIGLQVLALILWILVLRKVDVSLAYPFISLGFIFVLIIGYFFLGEQIDPYKTIGIACIILGIIFLSVSYV